MGSRRAPFRPGSFGALTLLIAGIAYVPLAPAQVPGTAPTETSGKSKAAGLFDDDQTSAKPKPRPDKDTIGFTQENVAAQMTELEERMFRLAEALRGLEPENASRLRLALKFSREEQILDQMRETHKLLKDAQVGKAETEVRELVAKLEHLRNLLLAEDLDFQLKLARLRQVRETVAQLDRIIKEEKRELGWSRFALDQRKRLEKQTALRPDLATLVREQESLIADTKEAAGRAGDSLKDALAGFAVREAKTRKAAAALAIDPTFTDQSPAHLRLADEPFGDAGGSLDTGASATAIASEERALGLLQAELTRFDEQTSQIKTTLADPEFRRRQVDQTKNREATDTLGVVSARLGDLGVSVRKDLIRASGSMRSAEDGLAKTSAGLAADDQSAALDSLAKSREDLEKSLEKLLVELRTELQSKLIGELTEMHELQLSIRETTQAQAPKVAQKSRTALIALGTLSKKEGELSARTDQLLALVEETEFGIALPTALRVLSREMKSIETWLKSGDASPRTIDLETRVEEDLLSMLQAIRRLPPGTPPPPGTPVPSDPRDRERELNRLVAELKLVRLLQSRLNDDTLGVDKTRPVASELPPALKREVEALESAQDEIRDSLAKIAERLNVPSGNE